MLATCSVSLFPKDVMTLVQADQIWNVNFQGDGDDFPYFYFKIVDYKIFFKFGFAFLIALITGGANFFKCF